MCRLRKRFRKVFCERFLTIKTDIDGGWRASGIHTGRRCGASMDICAKDVGAMQRRDNLDGGMAILRRLRVVGLGKVRDHSGRRPYARVQRREVPAYP